MREEKRQERREQIVEAARKLFLRFGFRKTTLDDIAREAGVGKATLYHYIRGKDELLEEMVQGVLDKFGKRLEGVLAQDCTSRRRLELYAEAWLAHHKEMQESSRMSPEERMEQFPKLHRFVRRFHQAEHKVLLKVLEEGIEAGEFRDVDAERVATLLIAAFKGMVAELWRKPADYSVVMRGFLDVLFHGLLKEQ